MNSKNRIKSDWKTNTFIVTDTRFFRLVPCAPGTTTTSTTATPLPVLGIQQLFHLSNQHNTVLFVVVAFRFFTARL
jgi:hypothetical protein